MYVDPTGNVYVHFEGGQLTTHSSNTISSNNDHSLGKDLSGLSSNVPVESFKHDQIGAALAFVEEQVANNPDQPIVISGHSLGGYTAIEIAQVLTEGGYTVDLVIVVDAFSVLSQSDGDILAEGLPEGVAAINFRQVGDVAGAVVEGAEDRIIDATHSAIDNSQEVTSFARTFVNIIHSLGNRYSSAGGKPIVTKDGTVKLGRGGRSGSFSCSARSCSASKVYKKSRYFSKANRAKVAARAGRTL